MGCDGPSLSPLTEYDPVWFVPPVDLTEKRRMLVVSAMTLASRTFFKLKGLLIHCKHFQ